MADRANPDAIDLVWRESELRLEAQLRQADALDTKAGVLVGLLAIGAGVLASVSSDLAGMGRWVAGALVLLIAVSAGFAFLAFRTQRYHRRPSPAELWRFAGWSPSQIKHRFLSTRFEEISRNRAKLDAKARYVLWSLITIAVIALVVTATSIVGLVT